MLVGAVKRDGRHVKFDSDKIEQAILKAYNDVDNEVTSQAQAKAKEIASYVANLDMDEITVEEIQDIIEQKLMNSRRKDVARQFVIYRNDRTRTRNNKSKIAKEIAKKLNASDVQNQNANIDERSFGGRVGEASDTVLKQYALDNCMSDVSRNNHLNNEVYIHDLNSYAIGDHNCLSIPFDHLLANGFETRQTDVRPAQTVNTAFQLIAVIFQLQSLQQFGGVSATHLDWTMVPYVRKSFYKHYMDGLKYFDEDDPEGYKAENLHIDTGKVSIESELYKRNEKTYQYAMDMTEHEIHQGVEALYHNLNTLQSRSGNQLPFTSINYGTCTLTEGRMITKALLDTSVDGIGRLHKTPIFPCGIFQLMEGVNREEGDPNYDLYQLALRSTAQRLYPNYVNCDVTMQRDWVAYDRKCKQEVIDDLSYDDLMVLIDRLNDNPELCDSLMLDVLDGESVSVRQAQIPIEIMSTMGCRTQNGADINGKDSYKKNVKSVIKNGKLYDDFVSCAQKDGRGNICPVTVIMPTLAMESVEKIMQQHSDMDLDTARDCVSDVVSGEKSLEEVGITDDITNDNFQEEVIEAFMDLLDAKIGDAKDMLLERFEWICGQSPESAKFMYENGVMAGYVPKEGIRSALKHGTLALGQIGLAETLQILIGCDQTTDEGMQLAKRIEQLFKDRCAEYKEKYKLNFGVYYTPKLLWAVA